MAVAALVVLVTCVASASISLYYYLKTRAVIKEINRLDEERRNR